MSISTCATRFERLQSGLHQKSQRRGVRSPCAASRDIHVEPKSQLDRRALVLSGLLGGAVLVAAADPLSVTAAETACTNFTQAADGIQWCDTKLGTGKTPKKGELIRCHYTGRLTSNGAVFDSSYERRRPLTFRIGVREVIQGWDFSILGDGEDFPPMKEGGKRRVIIPAELGYGAWGAGGVIPPNSSLTFDIELLGTL